MFSPPARAHGAQEDMRPLLPGATRLPRVPGLLLASSCVLLRTLRAGREVACRQPPPTPGRMLEIDLDCLPDEG